MSDVALTARAFWEGRVDASPTATALVHEGSAWSYAELDRSVNALANGLAARGVRAGTVVASLLPSSVDLLRLQLAGAKLGAIGVPLIAGSTRAEAEYVLGHCGAQLVVTDEAGAGAVDSSVAPLGIHHDIGALDDPDDDRPGDPEIDALAPHAIMYTSGSTGRPKGVVQPSAGLATTGRALAAVLGLAGDDNVLCSLPLFHTAATHMAFASAVAAGGRLTLVDRFSRERFWPLARAVGATATYMFPAQMAILMTAPPEESDRANDIRVCFSHIRNEPFCERFGIDVCAGWAMTENCGMGTVTRPGSGDTGSGRIGTPYPAEARVRVTGDDGVELPSGGRGEIWFSHPHVMLGYHGDPASTADSMRDGWVRSGDLGSLDEAGVLSFHGRIKNLIKRSGENIAGEEVEFALMSHPAVEEAVVFAVPDEIRTEEVFAAVCVRDGELLDPAALVDWCRERLSEWKAPRYIALRAESFPRLANGKTDRARVIGESDVARAWQRPAPARARV